MKKVFSIKVMLCVAMALFGGFIDAKKVTKPTDLKDSKKESKKELSKEKSDSEKEQLLAKKDEKELKNDEKAVRPDAAQLGDPIFNSSGSCALVAPCCDVESKCAPTVIVETGCTQTVKDPGTYCLGTDLVSPLIINSDSVTLDMNGHTIDLTAKPSATGITIVSGKNDVRISGGLIKGGAQGIEVGSATAVRIEDVTVINTRDKGVYLNGSNETLLNNVNCNNGQYGVFCEADTNTTITNSSFCFNDEDGLRFEVSKNGLVQNCTINDNDEGGFIAISPENCIVKSCVASRNADPGFYISGSNPATGAAASIYNSIAEENSSSGFRVASPLTKVLIQECTSNYNRSYGFEDLSNVALFYSNTACGNLLANYNGVTTAPISSAANADGVDNIDCTATSATCEAFTIYDTLSSAGTPLTNSGIYCLAEDLNAYQLVIDGDSITVDLNGHTINVPGGETGITIQSGKNDVRIINGYLSGPVSSLLGTKGIVVNLLATDVRIEDVTCTGFSTSIELLGALRTQVSRVHCANNREFGMRCFGDISTIVTDSVFNLSVIGLFPYGLYFLNSSNALVESCTMNLNGQAGLYIESCSNIVVRECIANNNIGVISNGDGFFVANSSGISLFNSVAESNGNDGFHINSPNSALVQGCTSNNNTRYGFKGVSGALFYSNTACGNGTENYNGVTTAPISSAANADGVDNIDCSDLASSCDATIIYENGATWTLTQPGRYCLATDLTSATDANLTIVSINGDSITLDLNGHTIDLTTALTDATGIIVQNATDVRIINGLIKGVSENDNQGVAVSSSNAVRIEDVTVVDCKEGGVVVFQSDQTLLNNVNCSNCSSGFRSFNDKNTTITNSSFCFNTDSGLVFFGSINGLVQNCTMNNNGETGFLCQNISQGSPTRVIVRDCSACSNYTDTTCDGAGGGAGFSIVRSEASLYNCVADYNCTGFNVSGNGATGLVQECTANNNINYGFNNISSALFYSNTACGNGTANYNGVTTAPISSAANADGVDNVDCNATSATCEAFTIYDSTTTPQILSFPGRYCLAQDLVNSVIVIAGDSITLDMNGHTIKVPVGATGITIQSGKNDVRISGGGINGGAHGIEVGSATTNISIEDVAFKGLTQEGIFVNGGKGSFINRCHMDSVGVGVKTVNDANTTIVDSIIIDSVNNGIQSFNSSNLLVEGCVLNGNKANGIYLEKVSNSEVVRCVASTSTLSGFLLTDGLQGTANRCSHVVIRECDANGNGNNSVYGGFNVLGSTDISVINCTAENNGGGGFLSQNLSSVLFVECIATVNNNGFLVDAGSTALVRGCIAKNNTLFGFYEGNPSNTNQYYSNVACDNGNKNYFQVKSAPISSPANADGVDNIDCTATNATCEAFTIYDTATSGQTQTLTASGRYCLAQDLVNSIIIINGDSITVDLNGHTINVPVNQKGIKIQSGKNDVRIINGLIKDGLQGIEVGDAKAVRIEDVTVVGSSFAGVYLNGSDQTLLNNVNCSTCGYGVFGTGDVNTTISNSSFCFNTQAGLAFSGSVDGLVQNSTMNNNNVNGFSASSTENCIVKSSVACKNADYGFSISGSNPATGAAASIYNSIAEENSNSGFIVELNVSKVLIQECTSNYNTTCGFQDNSNAALFYSNTACGNGTANYFQVTTAPISSAANADGVDNIDCTATNVTCEAFTIYDKAASSAQQTQTLTASGRYCLAQDLVNSVIIINGDSITLDLNGHTINISGAATGITIQSGKNDVRIINGLIQGGLEGIEVGDATAVRIEDVTVIGSVYGIYLNGSDQTLLNNVNCSTCAFGFFGTGDAKTTISNSSFCFNTESGLVFINSVDGLVQNCTMNNNSFYGFSSDNAKNCIVKSSVACKNINGFYIFGSNPATGAAASIYNSIAEENSNSGFIVGSNVSKVLIQECTSNYNSIYGFQNQSPLSTNQYYSNTACGNGDKNYFQVNSAPISSAANADGVDNIDCSIPNATCEAFTIYDTATTGQTQTLNVPGRYCLAQDLRNSVIEIAGDSITLDLNGHTIYVPNGNKIGITVSPGFNDIRIENGGINGETVGANTGISATSVVDLRITDVSCYNLGAGISLFSTKNTNVDGVICNNNIGKGLRATGDTNLTINNSSFCFNQGNGLQLDSQNNGLVQNCIMNTNDTGFSLSSGENNIVKSCVASKNPAYGFYLNGNVSVYNSIAEKNRDGFDANINNVLIQGCTSQFNTGNGFRATTGSLFYSNSACRNGTNYNAVTKAGISAPDCAGYWQNVNCDLTCTLP